MKVLLTSVCRPLRPEHGDAPSDGYELLYGQVTRAQGMFSPRTVNIRESLTGSRSRLVPDLKKLQWESVNDWRPLGERLTAHRSRIRLIWPRLGGAHPEVALLATMFHHYQD